MGYRNIQATIIEWDVLSFYCPLNRGNNKDKCRSRSMIKDDDTCTHLNCPLAYEPTPDEFKKLDKRLYESVEEHRHTFGWMLQIRVCPSSIYPI